MAWWRQQSTLERIGEQVRAVADLDQVRAALSDPGRFGARARAVGRVLGVGDRFPLMTSSRRRSRAGGGTVIMAAMVGAVAGAVAMFLLDPGRGPDRRTRVRDRVRRIARQTGEAVDDRSRGVVNRARGLVIDLRSRLPGTHAAEGTGRAGMRAAGQGTRGADGE
jgi:hypothetical protein